MWSLDDICKMNSKFNNTIEFKGIPYIPPPLDEDRNRVVEEAKTWLDTPFRNNACVKGYGVGCGGLLVGVYNSIGILKTPQISEFGYFPIGWSLHAQEEKYLAILSKYMKEVNEPLPGDTAVFKLKGVYGHSAIVINWPLVIHVCWKSKVEYSDALFPPLAGHPPKFFSPF